MKFKEIKWYEMDEIRHYLNGERDADYILRYWRQYTDAISTLD